MITSGVYGLKRKEKRNRIIGLMTGISIGFAAWGSEHPQPDPWRAAGNVQVVQSGMPASQPFHFLFILTG